MRLRQNQLCPIHRSRFCCGREAIPMERRPRQVGIRRIEDPHHPRGYRELRSTGEMRKLLNRKIVAQNGKCAICNAEFTEYSDIVPDHISPRGMGGAWRDDHPENIQAVHWWCNGKKGFDKNLMSIKALKPIRNSPISTGDPRSTEDQDLIAAKQVPHLL